MSSAVSPLSNYPNYDTAPGISLTLDANTTYLVRGYVQDKEIGGSSGTYDAKFNFTGTFSYVHFESFNGKHALNPSSIEVLNSSVDNTGTTPNYIEGIFRTTTGGILTLLFRKGETSPNDVEVLSSEVSIIKM